MATTAGDPPWLTHLREFDTLLSEHGYHLSDQFNALTRWEIAGDEIAVNELLHQT